jgi:hypothetical protein
MPSLTGKALLNVLTKQEQMEKIRKLEDAGKMAEAMSARADMMMTTPAPGPHRKLNLSG